MVDKVNWSSYKFGIYDPNTKWKDKGGIYIFAGSDSNNRWTVYYIGKTSDFSKRLSSHEKWKPAARLGATHVHARAVSQEANRAEVEAHLIQEFDPPLNKE